MMYISDHLRELMLTQLEPQFTPPLSAVCRLYTRRPRMREDEHWLTRLFLDVLVPERALLAELPFVRLDHSALFFSGSGLADGRPHEFEVVDQHNELLFSGQCDGLWASVVVDPEVTYSVKITVTFG